MNIFLYKNFPSGWTVVVFLSILKKIQSKKNKVCPKYCKIIWNSDSTVDSVFLFVKSGNCKTAFKSWWSNYVVALPLHSWAGCPVRRRWQAKCAQQRSSAVWPSPGMFPPSGVWVPALFLLSTSWLFFFWM